MPKLVWRRGRGTDRLGAPTVIIGAGAMGRALARELLDDSRGPRPVGFLDDDTRHRHVCGLPVLGAPEQLAEVAARAGAEAAVLALPALPRESLAELVGRAWTAGLALSWVPPGAATGRRGVRARDLRGIRLSQAIGRAEVDVPGPRANRLVAGRRVLITGAAGTVGSTLSREVARRAPAALWLLDRDGEGLGRVPIPLSGAHRVTVDLGDLERLARVFDESRPDLVFHLAGRSDLVPLELDPCEAVRANVAVTRHVVDAAVRGGAHRMVLASTDKAADPSSVLGATRRLAELVAQTAAGGPTRFATVRLGNVIAIPGSLLPMLTDRIPRGEAVVITHPEVARHFMTSREASGLLLESAVLVEEAETFVLDVGDPVAVVDLVHRYAGQLRLPEVTIRFNGLGPGEKLAEKFFSDNERRIRTAHPDIWATRPAPPAPGLRGLLDALQRAADRGDDAEVRILLRRSLPEYRPVRRIGPSFAETGCADPASL